MSQTRLAARATVIAWIGSAAQYMATLVSTPILIHGLGIVNYGLWSLISDVLGSQIALDIGLGISATKHLAELEAKQDWQGYANCVAIARRASRWQTLAILLMGMAISLAFPFIFDTATTPRSTVWIVAFLTSLGSCSVLLGNTSRSILRAKNRHDILNFSAQTRTLFMQISGATLIYFGGSLLQLAMLSLFMTVLLQVSLYIVAERTMQIPAGFVPQPDQGLSKKMFRFGGSMVFSQVAKLITTRSGRVVIGMLMGPQMVAFYEVAQQFTSRVVRLGSSLTPGVMPLAVRMNTHQDHGSLQRLAVIATRLLLMFGICAAIMLIALGGFFIRFWIDRQGELGFVANTYPVLILLAIATAIELPNLVASGLLVGMGVVRPVRNYAIVEAVLSITLSAILGWFHGIVGVGFGILLTQLVLGILLRPATLIKKLEMRPSQFLRDVVLRAIVSCIPCLLAAIGFYHLLPPTSLGMVIAEVALLAVLGMVPAAMIGLDAEIRRQLFKPILKRIRRAFTG